MTMLAPAPATVKPACRVLFDSASFRHHAPDFGTHANPDRPTVDEILAFWDGVTAEAREARLAGEHRARAIEAQARETRRADAMDPWMPKAKGYDSTDLADFAAGRLLTAAELRARHEAEEDARLLANCPADVFEAMAAARPFAFEA